MSLKDKFLQTGLSSSADTMRFFKASFEGFSGTGKSYTMALIACGIWERESHGGGVILIDTEESAKFFTPIFAEVGLVLNENFFVTRSRSLPDYKRLVHVAEEEHAILLIDSVTHIHEEMVAQYLKSKNRSRLRMEDHLFLKPFWKEHFAVPYVRARCHAMFTGRAAWEYSPERNEETGKVEDFVRSGVKMRGDNETAFEPDFLVLMSRCEHVEEQSRIKVWREGMIMKSRYHPLDGKLFKNPTFTDFEAAYQFVMTGSAHGTPGQQTPMHGMFDDPAQSRMARRRAIDKLLAELKGLYDSYVPGAGAKEKKLRADIAFTCFGQRSWEALEDMRLEDLQQGYAMAEYIMPRLEEAPQEMKLMGSWLTEQTRRALEAQADATAVVVPEDEDVPVYEPSGPSGLAQERTTEVPESGESHEGDAFVLEPAKAADEVSS